MKDVDMKTINDYMIGNMFDVDKIKEHRATYNLNITGPAKVGKTYFASKLDEPLSLIFIVADVMGYQVFM